MRKSNGEVLLAWPLKNNIITAGWLYNNGTVHHAIDERAGVGTPVYAAEYGHVDQIQCWDGITTDPTTMQSYGNMVRIRHEDCVDGMLHTRYAHLSSWVVRDGQTVNEGDLIGYSGETGNCYGAHLHFEVILNGKRVNPLNWLDSNFTVANDKVILGNYTSVDRSDIELQTLFIIDVNDDQYAGIVNICNNLKLPYESHVNNKIIIIPMASNGDAYMIMSWCIKNAPGKYFSESYNA